MREIRFRLLFTLLFTVTIAQSCAEPATYTYPSLQIIGRYTGGSELRLLIQTSRVRGGVAGHRDRVDRVVRYLLVVNLDAEGPISERAQLVGPVATSDSPRSATSVQTGLAFSSDDVRASAEVDIVRMNDIGEIIRMGPEKSQSELRTCILELSEDNAKWTDVGGLRDVPLSRIGDEFDVQTNSGRYVVRWRDERVQVWDRRSGQELDDPWLAATFSKYVHNPGLHSSDVLISDDLRYVVIRPCYDIPQKTFALKDSVYSRDGALVVFMRDTDTAQVFTEDWPSIGGPHGALTIDGELLLLSATNWDTVLERRIPENENTVSLMTPDQQVRFQWEADPKFAAHTPIDQHDVEGDRIMFYDDVADESSDEPRGSAVRQPRFDVAIWNYKTGESERHYLRLYELFEIVDGSYEPRSSIKWIKVDDSSSEPPVTIPNGTPSPGNSSQSE